MTKQLTENQQKFLDALFGEAKGKPAKAKLLAGYSEGTSTQAILDSLSEEIADRTRKQLAYAGPQAVSVLMDIMTEDGVLGAKEKLMAAKDILDRAGFSKTEKVQVEAKTPLFVLPPKQKSDEDED